MRRTAILEQDKVPTAPVRPNLTQKGLMGVRLPIGRHQQHHLARSDVDGSLQDALASVATDWHFGLSAHWSIASIERRCFRHDGFVQHENGGAGTAFQAGLKPPFASPQGAGPIARRYRAPVHRRRSLWRARRTLMTLTS